MDNTLSKTNGGRETIIPDTEILMAIKTEPEVVIEREEPAPKPKRKRLGWNEGSEAALLDLWPERLEELRAQRKNGRIYAGMADDLSKLGYIYSPRDVQVKLQNFTQRYKKEKAAISASGGPPSTWPNYEKVHKIIGGYKTNLSTELVLESIDETTDEQIDQLRVVMEQKLNYIQAQINVIIEAQEKQNLLLSNFIASQQDMKSKFPIKTAKNLEELDEEITPENRETYKNTIKTLLNPQGIKKNLKYIISTNIIHEYNIEGVHGKKCLKDFKNFYGVVIDSIEVTANSGTPEHQLREAIRLAKKRYLKNKSIARKNAHSNEMEYE